MTGFWPDALVWGIIGLLVGSFLNVVIFRLPKMMEKQWQTECLEATGKESLPQAPPFNLMVPRSRCQNCGHQIRWHENIPLVSFMLLRGRCSSCETKIGLRYPIVEFLNGLLFAFIASKWGINATGVAWSLFAASLVVLALIDWDTTLLPDDITLPLLWAGLIASALHWSEPTLESALWGAVIGYLSLWSIYWAFKLITGKEGMGYGDFKLYAALGAWLGWSALIPVILIASVLGVIVGICLKFSSRLREGGYMPFGPFLAFAGLCLMATGVQLPLRWLGF